MKKQIFWVSFLLLCLLCGFGSALTLYQNETQLIQTSDLIVHGKIIEVHSAWNAQKTHIETTAQLLVNDTLKNDDILPIVPGSTISVMVMGGNVGDISEWVEDTPVLIANTEGVFFLKKIRYNTYTVTNLFGVMNGNLAESTSPVGLNDVAAFKQKIIVLEQGNASGQTIDPVRGTTIPQKAGMEFASILVILGILFLFRKTGKP
jgi:hypothetical protein